MRKLLIWMAMAGGLVAAMPALAQGCAPAEAVTGIALPGRPYAVLAGKDGCTFYVSLAMPTPNGGTAAAGLPPAPGAVALVQYVNGNFAVTRTVLLAIQPQGMALSHDGAVLVAPGVDGVAFIDTAKLAAGAPDAVANLNEGGLGPIQASITPDDKILFVSDERSDTVTVIDLVKARINGFAVSAILGKIPVDAQPVGQALSSDGKYLYVSVEVAHARDGLATPCGNAQQGPRGGNGAAPQTTPQTTSQAAPAPANIPEGVLTVIDTAKAMRDPAHAVIASQPSGCRPVRVVLSADGAKAFVAARASNQILAFDTARLRAGASDARTGALILPGAAIGEALSRDGQTLYAGTPGQISLVNTRSLALTGQLPPGPGASAREMVLTTHGLLLAISGGRLDIIDPARVTPSKP